jgi:hypothetical protein
VGHCRDVKFGREPKLTAQQLADAQKLNEDGQRCEDVAALFKQNRVTLIGRLGPEPCTFDYQSLGDLGDPLVSLVWLPGRLTKYKASLYLVKDSAPNAHTVPQMRIELYMPLKVASAYNEIVCRTPKFEDRFRRPRSIWLR